MKPLKHELLSHAKAIHADPGEMERAPEFILDAPFPGPDLPELVESARVLHRYGKFKLPFPSTFIQVPMLPVGHALILLCEQHLTNICHKGVFLRGCLAAFVYGRRINGTWKEFNGGEGEKPATLLAIPGMHVDQMLRMERRKVKGEWVFVVEGDFFQPKAFDLVDEGFPFLWHAIASIALLHTRGVKVDYVPAPEKLNKARLKCRKSPINAHHVIRIQEHLKSERVCTATGERHRMRLHSVRGHMRHQPFGPGRRKVRDVWIAPFLRGYESEGVISHTYEIDEQRPRP